MSRRLSKAADYSKGFSMEEFRKRIKAEGAPKTDYTMLIYRLTKAAGGGKGRAGIPLEVRKINRKHPEYSAKRIAQMLNAEPYYVRAILKDLDLKSGDVD